jgi:O-antigen ligase
MLVAAAMIMSGVDLLGPIIAGDQYSIDTRGMAWEIVLNQVLPASPIIGLGPGNYYHYTSLYAILGYNVKFSSHNQYIDILAQMGVLGLILFGWLMAAIGRVAWSLRQRVSGFSRGYVFGCLAGLAATLASCMLGDWLLPFVYNIGLAGFRASMVAWMFLGGLAAVDFMTRPGLRAGQEFPSNQEMLNGHR